jgi:molybdopterin-binding protein
MRQSWSGQPSLQPEAKLLRVLKMRRWPVPSTHSPRGPGSARNTSVRNLRYGRKMPTFRIKEAASLLGVSTDTLRRWADQGRVETTTDDIGRLAVDGTALARLAQQMAASANHPEGRMVVAHSARNRFTGLVTRVVRDTVMAQVDIQAGPHRFVSLLSREAADELGLEPGMLVAAAVKATSVSVEIPASGPARP